jgi:ATP/ADP translocase
MQVLGWGGSALATPLVLLVSGAVFFAGSLFGPGTALPGTALAMMLALGPAAGIVAQVRQGILLRDY